MRGLSRTWPFAAALLVVYLAPAVFGWALQLTGSGADSQTRAAAAMGIARFFALVVDPVAAMVVGFFVGWRLGGVWAFPVLGAIIFLPIGITQFGATGAVFAAILLIFGLIGWFLGSQVHRRQQEATAV